MIGYGYCLCGCGEKTNIAAKTINATGIQKGEPLKFIMGHQSRMPEARAKFAQRTGELNPFYGKTHTIESKNKISESKAGSKLSEEAKRSLSLKRGGTGDGRYISKSGYVLLRKPDHPNANKSGCVAEHRYIMAEEIGRPILPEETVHHKNGIKTDNRIENLELRTGNHGPGQSIEDMVAHAIEILNEYAPCLIDSNLDENWAKRTALLELEMNRLRGRLLGALESFGISDEQERACKQILKQLSYDMQAALKELM